MPVATDVLGCLVRRIWAHQVSLFVSRSRDIDHPGSGSAQGLLSLAHAWSHFWKAAPQHPSVSVMIASAAFHSPTGPVRPHFSPVRH